MKYWDKAWSLVEGCTPVSAACDNCWLAQIEYRFQKPLIAGKALDTGRIFFSGNIRICKNRLDIPMKIKKPTTFAIWSDLFHESVPADFIKEAFEIMEYCEQHTFLVLTKRPERLEPVLYGQEGRFYLGGGDIIQNVWLGTTVENQEMADKRIPELLKCESFNLFLSIEPMLSKIKLPVLKNKFYKDNAIKQVIVGCESGHNARPTNLDWIRDLRDQCKAAGVPLFVKQLQVDGKFTSDINKFPEDSRIRELACKRSTAAVEHLVIFGGDYDQKRKRCTH